MEEVLLEFVGITGGEETIAVVTLNRPRAKNALNKKLCKMLVETLELVRKDTNVRAVIITGAGGCFSAGVDLKDPLFADPTMMTEAALNSPQSYMWQIQHIKVPVIAAVAGPCITGGMEVALNCDIIIASHTAVFRDTHSTYGIVPGGGMTQLLPRYIGLQSAKWMSLTGAPMGAAQAMALGLVSEVVDGDRLLPRALEVARAVAQKSSAVTRVIKTMQHEGLRHSVPDALRYELGIAIKHYVAMGKAGKATQDALSGRFASRSKL